jgi:hypothetical protein
VKSRAAFLLAAILLSQFALMAAAQNDLQDKDADKTAAPAAKKNPKKDQKKDAVAPEKKEEEKKPGMNADTFSGGIGAGDVDCGESKEQV